MNVTTCLHEPPAGVPFSKASAGYVGVSDGWTDLSGNFRMDWEFDEALDGNVAVNAGFLVGHCAIRRRVMGDDAVGNEATDEQLAEMERLLHESIDVRLLIGTGLVVGGVALVNSRYGRRRLFGRVPPQVEVT